MFSRYGRRGASSRLRMFQYARYLQEKGIAAAELSFFDDDYLTRLYEGMQTNASTAKAYLRRAAQMRGAKDADLLWIEKEALPWMPWLLEHFILPSGVPIVTDYDDAVFHSYDLNRSSLVRRLLGRKIDKLMATSTLVMAGNSYLAERARMAGASQIEIVPTVVDIHGYSVRGDRRAEPTPRIGWIGTPSTWTAFMTPLTRVLTETAAAEGARLLVVGAGKAAASHPMLENRAWTEETEAASIQDMDIGVMPLTDTPWARGKCGYKLIQYMACGLPVVASPVGVNAEIVKHGVNGFLATTEAEWRAALVTLLRNPDLRRKLGAEGRRKVEAQYSLQIWGPRVARMLKCVAQRGAS